MVSMGHSSLCESVCDFSSRLVITLWRCNGNREKLKVSPILYGDDEDIGLKNRNFGRFFPGKRPQKSFWIAVDKPAG